MNQKSKTQISRKPEIEMELTSMVTNSALYKSKAVPFLIKLSEFQMLFKKNRAGNTRQNDLRNFRKKGVHLFAEILCIVGEVKSLRRIRYF